MIGIGLLFFGYALFYWGLHHFIPPRYSIWTLLGIPDITNMSPIKLPTP